MRNHYFIISLLIILVLLSCADNSKDIPPPTINIAMPDDGFDIDKDSSFLISPKITYDISSTYNWQLNQETINTEKDYIFEKYDLGHYAFTFSVSTPSGSDTILIPVNALDIFTFEEFNELNDDGYNNNPENGYFEFDFAHFSNNNQSGVNEDWSGFAFSENTNKSNASPENEFSVYYTSGAESSKIFTVFKQSDNIDHRILFTDNKAHIIKSIEVNNSTWAYLTMQDGGIFDKKNNMDYYCLTIIGFDATGTELSSLDFCLADYRFETSNERYIVNSWRTIDLTSLGEVYSLGFKLTSSIDTDPEKFLPKYFCMDNLKIKT